MISEGCRRKFVSPLLSRPYAMDCWIIKVNRIYSVSPGPVTLCGLMDPESYFVSSEVAKLDREQELAKYDLLPMYPTGQFHFPALL